jgi:hypothetical protein
MGKLTTALLSTESQMQLAMREKMLAMLFEAGTKVITQLGIDKAHLSLLSPILSHTLKMTADILRSTEGGLTVKEVVDATKKQIAEIASKHSIPSDIIKTIDKMLESAGALVDRVVPGENLLPAPTPAGTLLIQKIAAAIDGSEDELANAEDGLMPMMPPSSEIEG